MEKEIKGRNIMDIELKHEATQESNASEEVVMYKLYINGTFHEHFSDLEKALDAEHQLLNFYGLAETKARTQT